MIDLPLFLRINPWTLGFIEKVGTIILALIGLIFALISEWHFRKLMLERQKEAVSIIVKVLIIEVLILGIAYSGHLLIS